MWGPQPSHRQHGGPRTAGALAAPPADSRGAAEHAVDGGGPTVALRAAIHQHPTPAHACSAPVMITAAHIQQGKARFEWWAASLVTPAGRHLPLSTLSLTLSKGDTASAPPSLIVRAGAPFLCASCNQRVLPSAPAGHATGRAPTKMAASTPCARWSPPRPTTRHVHRGCRVLGARVAGRTLLRPLSPSSWALTC